MASPQHIASTGDWDALLSTTMYVVADFTATWCGPCKMIAPEFEKLAGALSIPGYLAFAKIDVDENKPIAARYDVRAMPTFMFFQNGQQVAVHGNKTIQGVNLPALKAAADKISGLAQKKQAAGIKVGE